MTDLATHLERLGLKLYLDAFITEGFDTWDTLLDIQESDLDALGVKLGHRRKLQRAIADHRGISYERPLGSPAHDLQGDLPKPQDPRHWEISSGEAQLGDAQQPDTPVVHAQGAPAPQEQKRKYRRHPKPDENAPEKPPSAYVLFSNKTREDVKADNLTFTEIAKLVGERWQRLDPSEREPYESHAQALKDSYQIQLSAYKKTDSYRKYMRYLAEFKLKHGQTGDNKRPKLDPQSSGGSLSAASTVSDPVTPGAAQGRGGSLEAVSELPRTSVLPTLQSPSEVPPKASVSKPLLTASGGYALLSASRTMSPSSFPHEQDMRRAEQISSHSSVADETVQVRGESQDPLARTATLSLNTPSALSPSSSSTSTPLRLNQSGSSESLTWPGSRLTQQASPLSSSHGTSLAYTPPAATDSWRDRMHDSHRQGQASAMALAGYSPPLTLAPIMAPGRLPDLTRVQVQRTLPPLQRQYPTASSPHPSYPAPHLAQTHNPPNSRTPQPMEHHDNEAATTLATLAKRSTDEQMPPHGEGRW